MSLSNPPTQSSTKSTLMRWQNTGSLSFAKSRCKKARLKQTMKKIDANYIKNEKIKNDSIKANI